ncbi:hypothetical protein SAMD00019534_054650 [Acytostelium subglobosum LB1]|uniref:hypothetical protein n=1 Tax=Acytostelium subglobosum LB1 TaxID=1410327 RepID=UPI00064523B5|nr:hypothetical protein SAMD00019534_054650 [Acytostelium subglobosum LB1]GAM22290.1 hypothetical protein SAMD00019534_054650 [Acytostelium subglobosum LB1]|eukprot:XP_012754410.1 hypothetical protein SAMD00019534_054650 [Acytostelium subglobosum LB1]
MTTTSSTSQSNVISWKSFIFFDQRHNQCLYIKERADQTSTHSSIPPNFYGFPSIPNQVNNNIDQQQTLQPLFQQQQQKIPGVFYLGRLCTPFYLPQLKRDDCSYYIVLMDGTESLDLNSLNKLVNKSDDDTSSYSWLHPAEVINRFQNAPVSDRWLSTPETQRITGLVADLLKVLGSPSAATAQEQLGKPITPENDDIVGVQTPLLSTNLIVCCDGDSALIVDPGANQSGHHHFENILLTRIPEHVRTTDGGRNLKVFITHEHKDHWEGLPLVEKHFPNASLVAHPECLELIQTTLTKVSVSGAPFSSVSVDSNAANVDSGNRIVIGRYTFDIVSTPGHTSNSLCLFETTSRTLVAGDHIVGWGSSVLDHNSGNMKQYLHTTQSMIDVLKPSIALPAHGPSNYEPITLLQNYIKHRLVREKAILQAYRDGNTTLQDILSIVYKDLDPKLNQAAMMNIRLHLDKLKEDQEIQ